MTDKTYTVGRVEFCQNSDNKIQFSKLNDPKEWTDLPPPVVECKNHSEAKKAEEFCNMLISRIATLESLLSTIQEHIDYLHNDVHCHLCGGGDCKPDCRLDAIQALFNKESFQKELEEGFLK